MNISQFVKLVNGGEHLTDIESCMFFFEDPGIIKKRAEITAWNIFHGEVYILRVLECVEETDQPGRLCRR
jgi:hypothetical protein